MQKKLYKSCYQPVNAGGYKQPHMHTTQEDFKDGWWSQPKAPLTDGQGRKRSKPRNRGCVCVQKHSWHADLSSVKPQWFWLIKTFS